MTPRLKKILALGLVVLVGIVWIPQILSASAKREPVGKPEVSALGATSARSASDGGARVRGGASEVPVGAGREDLAQALEASVARARLVVAEQSGADLTQLASAWAASTPAPAPPPVTPTVSATIEPLAAHEPAAPVVVELAPPADPIDGFLEAHPLRGTLIGATQRLACLGPLLVAVGDEPVKGLVVSAIEPRFVTFTRGQAVVRADLIPFQARAPTRVANTPNAGGATQGAATPAPLPAAIPAGNELDKVPPQPKPAADPAHGSSSTDAAHEKQPAPKHSPKDKP